MHFFYIIYSERINRYYVGETHNMDIRLGMHQTKYYPKSFTSKSNDWQLKILFEVLTREEALFLESFIKRMKSRNFIEKIIKNPEMLEEILTNRLK
jgi:putative endonuclease